MLIDEFKRDSSHNYHRCEKCHNADIKWDFFAVTTCKVRTFYQRLLLRIAFCAACRKKKLSPRSRRGERDSYLRLELKLQLKSRPR